MLGQPKVVQAYCNNDSEDYCDDNGDCGGQTCTSYNCCPTDIGGNKACGDSWAPSSPKAKISLFDLVRMQNELKEIFGREVDLVERKAIEKNENYIRRKSILSNTKVIYAAR